MKSESLIIHRPENISELDSIEEGGLIELAESTRRGLAIKVGPQNDKYIFIFRQEREDASITEFMTEGKFIQFREGKIFLGGGIYKYFDGFEEEQLAIYDAYNSLLRRKYQ